MELPAGVTTMVNRNNTITLRGSTIVTQGDILSVLVSQKDVKKVTMKVLSCFSR